MPRDERQRQKAAARKAERRKERKATSQRAAPPVRPSRRMAARWPLHECLLSRSWREPGELVQILVSRKGDAAIASAGFLVDLGCLGVKDALTNVLAPPAYEAFRSSYASRQPMKRADLDLVAKIIQEGIAYAGRLGFSPHPDYHDAAILLEGADPARCTTPIPLGMNGKPFYIPGPFDNPAGIVRQIERAVGPGNFHYVLELNDLPGAAEMDAGDGEPEARRASFLPRLLRRLRPGRGRGGGGD